ncbi:MAG: HAMP domain-containing histidine kinase [Lachnospiraceae bacterium]|nr:HAMP domain-containing histidine kinase [Lachnospiraceae bacterium]
MYQKTRLKLAGLFTGITWLLLVSLSVGFQAISEKDSRENSFLSFTGEMNTLLSNLESQQTITYEWITKVRAGDKYIIALYDNGEPLSYTVDILTAEELRLAEELAGNNKEWIEEITDSSAYGLTHKEFAYKALQQEYYVSISNVHRSSGNLCTLILFSTKELETRFFRQRMLLMGMNMIALLLLFFFSYFYTGRLMRPIKKSYEQQASFIAAASHELRTPLSVILSCNSALQYAEPFEQEPFFRTIESEGNRMSHLISDMLTLARSDSHNWSFCMKKHELDTILLNLYEAYKPIATGKGIDLFLQLEDKIFPVCNCDEERITQVMEILLSNAISYGREKGIIILKLIHRRREFCLQVIDNGIGISPSAKDHIFERFYREDASRSGKEHFGLGLSIAQEIITAHHGKISVSDTPGGGTTFTIILPQ